MRPVGIELGDELVQDDTQVLLVENDEVVEALVLQGRVTRSATTLARSAHTGLSRGRMPRRRARRTKSPP